MNAVRPIHRWPDRRERTFKTISRKHDTLTVIIIPTSNTPSVSARGRRTRPLTVTHTETRPVHFPTRPKPFRFPRPDAPASFRSIRFRSTDSPAKSRSPFGSFAVPTFRAPVEIRGETPFTPIRSQAASKICFIFLPSQKKKIKTAFDTKLFTLNYQRVVPFIFYYFYYFFLCIFHRASVLKLYGILDAAPCLLYYNILLIFYNYFNF